MFSDYPKSSEEHFKESLKDGEYGEHAIWNLLNKMKRTRNVIDVREDKGFQEKDIDFLVEDINRQITFVEVKTDYQAQDSGNIVYEVSTSGNKGCFEKTEAKYVIYFIPKTQVAYFIDVPKLRNYVKSTNHRLVSMGDYAKGYLLPIHELSKEKVIVDSFYNVK